MCEDRDPARIGPLGRIEAVGEPGAVTRLEPRQLRQPLATDRHRALVHRGERRGRRQRRRERGGEPERGDAGEREWGEEGRGDEHDEPLFADNSIIQSNLQLASPICRAPPSRRRRFGIKRAQLSP